MKLLDKQIITVQGYPGRKFGAIIGSNEGLIGIQLNIGEYIGVPQGRVRIISTTVEIGGKTKFSAIRTNRLNYGEKTTGR